MKNWEAHNIKATSCIGVYINILSVNISCPWDNLCMFFWWASYEFNFWWSTFSVVLKSAMNSKQVIYPSFDLIKSYWPFFRSLRHELKKAHFLTKKCPNSLKFNTKKISTLFPIHSSKLKNFPYRFNVFFFQFTKLNVKSFLFIDHENVFRPISFSFILQVMNFKYSDDFFDSLIYIKK